VALERKYNPPETPMAPVTINTLGEKRSNKFPTNGSGNANTKYNVAAKPVALAISTLNSLANSGKYKLNVLSTIPLLAMYIKNKQANTTQQ
jgi:hypothetical protein